MKKIVFCIDENYIKPLAVALQSFLQHHIARDYEISVLYSNIESSEKYKFINFFEKSSLKIEFIYIDYDFSWIPVGYHFNSVIFFRLLIPSIFKNENKILYLDSDILFLSNIDEVFDFDLGSNILAAIPRDKIHGIPEYLQGYVKKYFASGFLLFNVNEFIKQDCFNKALFYLRTRHYEMPDQDALNYAVTNSFDVPYRYGMETSFLENEHPGKELKYELENIKIIQFSGSSKPWHIGNNHPYKYLYWKYLHMTIYKYSLPTDLTLLNVLKWMIPKFIKRKLKLFFVRRAPS